MDGDTMAIGRFAEVIAVFQPDIAKTALLIMIQANTLKEQKLSL
jgi:hypothetical protein